MTGCVATPTPTPTSTNTQRSPVPTPTATDSAQFDTSGYTPQPVKQLPYTGARFIDVTSPEHPVDSAGVAIYRDSNGVRHDHPVVEEQYALSALNEYHATGNQIWLNRAVANANHLIDDSLDRDGAMWFAYPFNWTYYKRTLIAPWYSGMAQGTALSLFSRLAEEQPKEPRWRTAANATWKSFTQRYAPKQPWSTLIDHHHLWFEEYAGNQPPLLVLNGHIFALYGLYDYFMLTKNPEVSHYFDGGATTVRENMPLFRVPGGVAYYCVQADYCHSKDWQNAGYQGIHIDQLAMLAKMTGDSRFQDWSNKLASDAPRLP